MIVVFAGRRIDDPSTKEVVFAIENIPVVRSRLQQFFMLHPVTALVCSAASGADLLALDIADSLGIQREIILPTNTSIFKQTSVIDRPGPWENLYKRLVETPDPLTRVLELQLPAGELAYAQTTIAIVKQGLQKASLTKKQIMGLVVWEGHEQAAPDYTADFIKEARNHQIPVEYLLIA